MQDKDKPKFVFKLDERHSFFQKLEKLNFSLVFKFIKKETERGNNKIEKKQSNGSEKKSKLKWSNGTSSNNYQNNGSLSQKFKFKQLNPSIEEEGQRKIMLI